MTRELEEIVVKPNGMRTATSGQVLVTDNTPGHYVIIYHRADSDLPPHADAYAIMLHFAEKVTEHKLERRLELMEGLARTCLPSERKNENCYVYLHAHPMSRQESADFGTVLRIVSKIFGISPIGVRYANPKIAFNPLIGG